MNNNARQNNLATPDGKKKTLVLQSFLFQEFPCGNQEKTDENRVWKKCNVKRKE